MNREKPGVYILNAGEIKRDFCIKCFKCGGEINTLEEGYVRYYGHTYCQNCSNKVLRNDNENTRIERNN